MPGVRIAIPWPPPPLFEIASALPVLDRAHVNPARSGQPAGAAANDGASRHAVPTRRVQAASAWVDAVAVHGELRRAAVARLEREVIRAAVAPNRRAILPTGWGCHSLGPAPLRVEVSGGPVFTSVSGAGRRRCAEGEGQ